MDIPWLLILYISLGGGAALYLFLLWLKWRQDKKWGKMVFDDRWRNATETKTEGVIVKTLLPPKERGQSADFDPFKKPERATSRAMWVIAALASTPPSCGNLTATERALLDDAANRAIDRVLPKPVRAQK